MSHDSTYSDVDRCDLCVGTLICVVKTSAKIRVRLIIKTFMVKSDLLTMT